MSQIALSILYKTKERLQQALEEIENLEAQLKELPLKTLGEIELTPQALDFLPWKLYESGRGAWIFSNLDNLTARTLRSLLEKANGRLELHGYLYRFSGLERKFISRYPMRGK